MNKLLVLFTILGLSTGAVFADNHTLIKIHKIFDGDTVEASIEDNKFRIRLIGIDCYETSKISRAYKQAYANNLSIDDVVQKGNKSKMYLENLYKQYQNKPISLDFKGLDVYGRALGVIYFDKLNVNKDLINNGGCMIYEYKKYQ